MKLIINDNSYDIDEKITNLLDAFIFIKENLNNSLAFDYGCKSGVCGSCAIRVNGVEKLACTSNFACDDKVLPLNNLPVVKDLIFDNSAVIETLKKSNGFLENCTNGKIFPNDVDKIEIESSCILCSSCYSSCPVYSVNGDFLGPFALTRVYRYLSDSKELVSKNKLDAIQLNGIWDCTLCGACNLVCPQSIDIKGDILKLQNLSVQNGYENPLFSSFNNSFGNFDSDFGGGFNPNGF